MDDIKRFQKNTQHLFVKFLNIFKKISSVFSRCQNSDQNRNQISRNQFGKSPRSLSKASRQSGRSSWNQKDGNY